MPLDRPASYPRRTEAGYHEMPGESSQAITVTRPPRHLVRPPRPPSKDEGGKSASPTWTLGGSQLRLPISDNFSPWVNSTTQPLIESSQEYDQSQSIEDEDMDENGPESTTSARLTVQTYVCEEAFTDHFLSQRTEKRASYHQNLCNLVDRSGHTLDAASLDERHEQFMARTPTASLSRRCVLPP